ncbi:MAG: DUF2254 domain-containing protein [Bacteroidota bacterium]
MRARFLEFWDSLQSSYWFVPSLMTLGALVLAFVLPVVDERVGPEWALEASWFYANKPDGARTLLSTVAGSMIGVAGVTFSVTIASVVYASGQYGPRLLSNFMRDRGNQVTLGTFIATFLYGLLVLRTIRAGDESGTGELAEAAASFVPHLSILVALGLALASIAVLIYFIHHVPESIHVSNVIAGIGRELKAKVQTAFPGRMGEGGARASGEVALPGGFVEEATPIEAHATGYVQGIDADGLFEVASAHGLVLRLRARPGDFVTEGDTVVLAWVPRRLDEDAASTIRGAFAYGRRRTPLQDVRFLVNELVEIAARALSPGVNDPFTAQSCLDWLGAALKTAEGRDFPSEARYDADGDLRLVANATTYAELVEGAFGQLRPYVAADRNAALHALKVLGDVAGRTAGAEARAVLRREAEGLVASAEQQLVSTSDIEAVRERLRVVAGVLAGNDYEARAAATDWLGGSA